MKPLLILALLLATPTMLGQSTNIPCMADDTKCLKAYGLKPCVISAHGDHGTLTCTNPPDLQEEIAKLVAVVAKQQKQIRVLQGEVSELHEQQQKMSEAMQELYDQCKQEKVSPE